MKKVSSVRRMGADVRLVGDNFDEAAAFARALSEEQGMAYIPPFDHPLVIAGQVGPFCGPTPPCKKKHKCYLM